MLNVGFSWSPLGVPLSFTVGGQSYPPVTQVDGIVRASDSRYITYTTPSNTLLTFVGVGTPDAGKSIIEYRWDFGDGTVGRGPSVTHTYIIAGAQTAVTLTVKDSVGTERSQTRVLNLRPTTAIAISPRLTIIAP